jgi:hypothetical protein
MPFTCAFDLDTSRPGSSTSPPMRVMLDHGVEVTGRVNSYSHDDFTEYLNRILYCADGNAAPSNLFRPSAAAEAPAGQESERVLNERNPRG